MEGIFGIIAIFIAITVINWVFRAIIGAGKAGIETVTKGGDFSENWKKNTFGMSAFEIRVKQAVPDAGEKFVAYEVDARGLIPVKRRTSLAFIVSLFDVTDDEPKPVLSRVDDFAESDSVAYQFSMDPVDIDPDQGFSDWVRVGVIIPELLIPPKKGARKLSVVVRLMDHKNPVDIRLGFADGEGGGLLGTFQEGFTWTFENRGYEDAKEIMARQKPLFVKLGVAVAMADGDFADSEGAVISKWIERQLSSFDDDEKARVKDACNDALRTSFGLAKTGDLSLTAICDDILEHSEHSDRYEAIELALDVMAADGVADAAEIELIRRVSTVFDLDFDELQKMKDERLVGIKSEVDTYTSEGALLAALGIDPEWSDQKTKKFLTSEFKKWNARLNNLQDPEERDNVQARIDLISQARKQYA